MKTWQIVLALGVTLGLVVLGFNNCSQVDFAKVQSATEKTDTSTGGLAQDEGGGDGGGSAVIDPGEALSDADKQILLSQYDPSTPLIPVSELQNDPSLVDKFPCKKSDGSTGVAICHLTNLEAAGNNLCLPLPPANSVDSHFDHVLTLADGSQQSDYLGVCVP